MSYGDYNNWIASQKRPREVLRIGKVEVIQNPTDGDYRYFCKKVRELFPQIRACEVKIRTTRDNFGNRWIWMAHAALHADIEPELSNLVGVDLNQNNYVPMYREWLRENV